MLIVLITPNLALGQQPLVVIREVTFSIAITHVPLMRNECIAVYKSGDADIVVRTQQTPKKAVVDLEFYKYKLDKEQLKTLKVALHSADTDNLSEIIEPAPTGSVEEWYSLIVTIMSQGKTRRVGYTEIKTLEGKRTNDEKSAMQVDQSSRALAPVKRWLRSIDLKLAVPQTTATDTCKAVE